MPLQLPGPQTPARFFDLLRVELRAGAERVEEPSVGHPIRVAGIDDLISMKEAAGRDIDRIDITALRMTQGLEE
jgi:hypothetical protein